MKKSRLITSFLMFLFISSVEITANGGGYFSTFQKAILQQYGQNKKDVSKDSSNPNFLVDQLGFAGLKTREQYIQLIQSVGEQIPEDAVTQALGLRSGTDQVDVQAPVGLFVNGTTEITATQFNITTASGLNTLFIKGNPVIIKVPTGGGVYVNGVQVQTGDIPGLTIEVDGSLTDTIEIDGSVNFSPSPDPANPGKFITGVYFTGATGSTLNVYGDMIFDGKGYASVVHNGDINVNDAITRSSKEMTRIPSTTGGNLTVKNGKASGSGIAWHVSQNITANKTTTAYNNVGGPKGGAGIGGAGSIVTGSGLSSSDIAINFYGNKGGMASAAIGGSFTGVDGCSITAVYGNISMGYNVGGSLGESPIVCSGAGIGGAGGSTSVVGGAGGAITAQNGIILLNNNVSGLSPTSGAAAIGGAGGYTFISFPIKGGAGGTITAKKGIGLMNNITYASLAGGGATRGACAIGKGSGDLGGAGCDFVTDGYIFLQGNVSYDGAAIDGGSLSAAASEADFFGNGIVFLNNIGISPVGGVRGASMDYIRTDKNIFISVLDNIYQKFDTSTLTITKTNGTTPLIFPEFSVTITSPVSNGFEYNMFGGTTSKTYSDMQTAFPNRVLLATDNQSETPTADSLSFPGTLDVNGTPGAITITTESGTLSDLSVSGTVVISVPSTGGKVTINGTDYSSGTIITGLTVEQTQSADHFAISSDLTVTAAATGEYISIFEGAFGGTLTVTGDLTFDGNDQGTINNTGTLIAANITMNSNSTATDTAISNSGTLQTAGTLTMNSNSNTGTYNYNYPINNAGTIIATTGIVLNNNTNAEVDTASFTNAFGSTMKTDGMVTITTALGQPYFTSSTITITDTSDTALLFSDFVITIAGDSYGSTGGNYTTMQTDHANVVNLAAANQS